MADEVTESDSTLDQQQDPNGDLMKARPGGETDIGYVPNSRPSSEKPDATLTGSDSAAGDS
jgi:hypothetical protein